MGAPASHPHAFCPAPLLSPPGGLLASDVVVHVCIQQGRIPLLHSQNTDSSLSLSTHFFSHTALRFLYVLGECVGLGYHPHFCRSWKVPQGLPPSHQLLGGNS